MVISTTDRCFDQKLFYQRRKPHEPKTKHQHACPPQTTTAEDIIAEIGQMKKLSIVPMVYHDFIKLDNHFQAAYIRELRLKYGATDNDLAAMMGCSPDDIHRIITKLQYLGYEVAGVCIPVGNNKKLIDKKSAWYNWLKSFNWRIELAPSNDDQKEKTDVELIREEDGSGKRQLSMSRHVSAGEDLDNVIDWIKAGDKFLNLGHRNYTIRIDFDY